MSWQHTVMHLFNAKHVLSISMTRQP